MPHTRPLALGALALLGTALAATSTLKFYINDRPVPDAIVVNGQAYVPVSALKAAGLNVTTASGSVRLSLPPAGGANQVAGVEGCLGQTLFNGVWRLRVTDVRPVASTYANQPGFEITAEVRNATNQTLDLTGTGFGLTNVNLAYTDGTTSAVESVASNRDAWDHNKAILPAASYLVRAQVPADAGKLPSKLVYQRAGNVKAGLPWSTPDPSFRVDLTCKK